MEGGERGGDERGRGWREVKGVEVKGVEDGDKTSDNGANRVEVKYPLTPPPPLK